jgi:hypothetical protein
MVIIMKSVVNNGIIYSNDKTLTLHKSFVPPTIKSYEIMNLHAFVSDEIKGGTSLIKRIPRSFAAG